MQCCCSYNPSLQQVTCTSSVTQKQHRNLALSLCCKHKLLPRLCSATETLLLSRLTDNISSWPCLRLQLPWPHLVCHSTAIGSISADACGNM